MELQLYAKKLIAQPQQVSESDNIIEGPHFPIVGLFVIFFSWLICGYIMFHLLNIVTLDCNLCNIIPINWRSFTIVGIRKKFSLLIRNVWAALMHSHHISSPSEVIGYRMNSYKVEQWSSLFRNFPHLNS